MGMLLQESVLEAEEIFELASRYRALGGLEVQLRLLRVDATASEHVLIDAIMAAFESVDALHVLNIVTSECPKQAPVELLVANGLIRGITVDRLLADLKARKIGCRVIATAFATVAEQSCGVCQLDGVRGEAMHNLFIHRNEALDAFAAALKALKNDMDVGYFRLLLARMRGG